MFTQIRGIEAGLLAAYPDNGLVNQLETGTRFNSYGTVEAYLSINPTTEWCKESINLTFSVACEQHQTIFSSEIAWSGGRTIEDVVVCRINPDCLDEMQEKVENVVMRTQEPLVNRMVTILENLCQE